MSIVSDGRRKNKAGLVNRFLGHVLPGIIRPMHALWNEVIGFVFIVLAFGPRLRHGATSGLMDGNSESFFKAADLGRIRAADGSISGSVLS